jgi:hypothetical protein
MSFFVFCFNYEPDELILCCLRLNFFANLKMYVNQICKKKRAVWSLLRSLLCDHHSFLDKILLCWYLLWVSYHVRIGSVGKKKRFWAHFSFVPFFIGGVIIVSHDERLIRDVGCQVKIRNNATFLYKGTYFIG